MRKNLHENGGEEMKRRRERDDFDQTRRIAAKWQLVCLGRRTQMRCDLMARVRYGSVGERRVAKTVEILCVTAHMRVETLRVLDLNRAGPRLGRRSRLRNLNKLGYWF